jgi:hypothetical protein
MALLSLYLCVPLNFFLCDPCLIKRKQAISSFRLYIFVYPFVSVHLFIYPPIIF